MNHWIILPIIGPALTAAILLLPGMTLGRQRAVSLAGLAAIFGCSMGLLSQATDIPAQAYALGDWPAPFGIYLVLDRLSSLMVALTVGLSFLMSLYAVATNADEQGRHFHAMVQFLVMGLCGAFLTADAFNLFVFFEVLLIASYGLMVHGGGARRTRAAIQYVAFNLLGSSVFLIALATLYSVMGTLNMADLSQKLPLLASEDAGLVKVATVLFLFVFAVKTALVPLHLWMPSTYANAPAVVAALFAIMTKLGVYATLRFGTLVFPTDLEPIGPIWASLLMPAALMTMAVGAFGVLGSAALLRMSAFAGITSTGTIILALQSFTTESTAAALYYMLHSTVATALLFLIADQIVRGRAHDDLTLPAARIPGHGLLSVLFFVTAIAVVGLPPLSGFVGKLMVLQSLWNQSTISWTAVLLVSFILMVAFARAGSTVFWKAAEVSTQGGLPKGGIVVIFACAFVLIGMTVAAGSLSEWFMVTAEQLHDPSAYVAANALPKKD